MHQICDKVLMVRPAAFGANPETAASNAFQASGESGTPADVQQRALEEFDDMVTDLRAAGIEVVVETDTSLPPKPDAIFPNNWFSTHADGKLVLYPMCSQIRRQERRMEIVDRIRKEIPVKTIWSLADKELEDRFLEGTGSMVLDRENRVCYACASVRTHKDLLETFCREMHYRLCYFRAYDMDDQPIYHTNVLMAVGLDFAVICLEAIHDPVDRNQVEAYLTEAGKLIVPITKKQMHAFAGNMLQLRNKRGEAVLVMSEQAHRVLRSEQLKTLSEGTNLLAVKIETIETYGGGSARCMMAELFSSQ